MPFTPNDSKLDLLREAAYITIGFGVLSIQQAQVRRRELVANLNVLEAKVDAAVVAWEQALPGQAGILLGQAHSAARIAREQARGLIRTSR
jgi:hypothetical protein